MAFAIEAQHRGYRLLFYVDYPEDGYGHIDRITKDATPQSVFVADILSYSLAIDFPGGRKQNVASESYSFFPAPENPHGFKYIALQKNADGAFKAFWCRAETS